MFVAWHYYDFLMSRQGQNLAAVRRVTFCSCRTIEIQLDVFYKYLVLTGPILAPGGT